MWYQVLETQPSKADSTWHLCEKNSTPEWLRTVLWKAWRRVRVVCSVSVLRPVFVSSCLVLCVLCLVLSCHGAGSTWPRLPWRQQHKATSRPASKSSSNAFEKLDEQSKSCQRTPSPQLADGAFCGSTRGFPSTIAAIPIATASTASIVTPGEGARLPQRACAQ